jgi:glycerol uptake facilitator-like aquaporin
MRDRIRVVRALGVPRERSLGESPSLSLARRAASEGVATAFLLAAIVGSGIMAERLAGGNTAVALLANSLASGAALAALILGFAEHSGAHMNPLVTLADAWRGRLPFRDAAAYVPAQLAGAFAGVVAAHAMFGEPLLSPARRVRGGAGLLLAEVIATFGLLVVIRGSARLGVGATAASVGCYILAAYWFTSSTSFANPAVTLARTLSDTFTGIRPSDAPGFLAAQLAGGGAGAVFLAWLEPEKGSAS